jgi:hypothetical protein
VSVIEPGDEVKRRNGYQRGGRRLRLKLTLWLGLGQHQSSSHGIQHLYACKYCCVNESFLFCDWRVECTCRDGCIECNNSGNVRLALLWSIEIKSLKNFRNTP